jgi:hypothetical protein
MLVTLRFAGLFDPVDFFLSDLIWIISLPAKRGLIDAAVGSRR